MLKPFQFPLNLRRCDRVSVVSSVKTFKILELGASTSINDRNGSEISLLVTNNNMALVDLPSFDYPINLHNWVRAFPLLAIDVIGRTKTSAGNRITSLSLRSFLVQLVGLVGLKPAARDLVCCNCLSLWFGTGMLHC